jgi:hypothetical protein
LPEWVRDCASSDGSGDDVTAVVLLAAGPAWLAAAESRPRKSPATAAETPVGSRPLIPTQRSRPASHRLAPAPRSSRRLRLPQNRLIGLAALVAVVLAAGIGIWLGLN